jgi:hypothetical protein
LTLDTDVPDRSRIDRIYKFDHDRSPVAYLSVGRRSRRKGSGREAQAVQPPSGELVEVELDVGRDRDVSYFVSAVFVPSGQGYAEVSREPEKREWYKLKGSRALAIARYMLPEGSVIIYKRATPGSVETKAFLVTREGLRELEVTSEKEHLESVGGRQVYRYVDVVRVPLGTIRKPSDVLYMEGVGKVKPDDLEAMRKQAAYPLAVTGLSPFSFKVARKLSDDEIRAIEAVGLRYEGTHFSVPLDEDIDIEKVLQFLRENAYGFTERDAERLLEGWRRSEPERDVKRLLRQLTGLNIREVNIVDRELLRRGKIMFRPERVDDKTFEELRRRFEYLGNGWFAASFCVHRELMAPLLKAGAPPDKLEEVCRKVAEREADVERVKKVIKERFGVEPTSVESVGIYYAVKFPYLGREKFREIASHFGYRDGWFWIEKEKLKQ